MALYNHSSEGSKLLQNEENPKYSDIIVLNSSDKKWYNIGVSKGCIRMHKIRLAVLVLIFLAAAISIIVFSYHRSSDKWNVNQNPLPSTVTTDCGLIDGLVDDATGVTVFKGIPYAVPPVGHLRWKAPIGLKEDGKCWKGTLKAHNFSECCSQLEEGKMIGNEDCLYLNVLTPNLSKKSALPVMVWIHGGSLIMGSGADTLVKGYYPNARFVKEMNIVAVSINYRLNAFGFMTLDVLSEASPTQTSGNYGLMDQILSLKWVQNNIEQFGGDKTKVTVLGQSSGGTSLFGMLAAESALGLFQTVIAQSGSPIFNKTAKEASADNLIFVRKSKCQHPSSTETLNCLYNLSASEILKATPWDVYPYWAMTDLFGLPKPGQFDGALIVIDGHVIKYPPGEIAQHQSNRNQKVTVIIGNTAQETGFQPPRYFKEKEYDIFIKYIAANLSKFMGSEDITKAIKLYSGFKPPRGSRPQYLFETMVSDERVICATDIFAANLSKSTHLTVYRYIDTAAPSHTVYYGKFSYDFAFHMWDTLALFGFYDMPRSYMPKGGDLEFMHSFQKNMRNFFYSAKPNGEEWKPYPLTTAIFHEDGLDFTGPKVYHEAQCKFWMDHGFWSYSWIN